MIRAAAAAQQTYRPQRAATQRKPPGPSNRFQLLDNDVPDIVRHAADGTGATAGAQESTGQATLHRSASVGRAPAASPSASPAATVGAAATRPPTYLPPRLPPAQTASATPHNLEPQQAPSQPPPPRPSLEMEPPPQTPAAVEPAAPRPTSAPAVLLGEGAADNFECPLTMDIMEDPVCARRVWVDDVLHHLDVLGMSATAATYDTAEVEVYF
jgi:hypothetical protein